MFKAFVVLDNYVAGSLTIPTQNCCLKMSHIIKTDTKGNKITFILLIWFRLKVCSSQGQVVETFRAELV